MNLIVSNYGFRLLQHAINHQDEPLPLPPEVMKQLLGLRIASLQSANGEPWQADLVARGLAQWVAPEMTADEAELRYQRNPLQHVERLVFEFTTVCNLNCDHCRNGHLPAVTEAKPERLCEAVDLALPLGIRRFSFVGGEVILYGAKWLRVVEHIKLRGGATTAVLTSGWFLEERDFKAAGARYRDDLHLLSALAEAGVTYVVFSLDGPAEVHDRSRHVPGLHDRILKGFSKVREAGMMPKVSLVLAPEMDASALAWLAEVATALYQLDPAMPLKDKVYALQYDHQNFLSHLVDTGNAVQLRRKGNDFGPWKDEELRCKNFFRPHPSLRIQATGEVSLCPLIDAGEGYGNVHQRGLLDVMNHLQDAFTYQLHADKKIANYRRFLDPKLFGGRFDHLCSLRTVLGMLARRMHERGVGEQDADAIQAINVEVARLAGYLPPEGRTGNGTSRPLRCPSCLLVAVGPHQPGAPRIAEMRCLALVSASRICERTVSSRSAGIRAACSEPKLANVASTSRDGRRRASVVPRSPRSPRAAQSKSARRLSSIWPMHSKGVCSPSPIMSRKKPSFSGISSKFSGNT